MFNAFISEIYESNVLGTYLNSPIFIKAKMIKNTNNMEMPKTIFLLVNLILLRKFPPKIAKAGIIFMKYLLWSPT